MNTRTKRGTRRGFRGAFSLVEVLVVVGVIGILAAVAVPFALRDRDKAALQKLESDVRSLNAAVQVFQVSGGAIDGISSPLQIVSALQAETTALSAEQSAGLTGRRIDARIVVEMQTAAEAASDQARAIWDQAKGRFEIAFSGPAGVKRFGLSEAAATADKGEVVLNPTMKLAVEDPWIWDYADAGATSGTAPTTVPTHPSGIPGGVPGGPPTTTPPPSATAPLRLSEPVYSIPDGSYPIADFDLMLYLSDPNPDGVSKISYSVNGGTWSMYSDGTAIPVTPGSRVVAKAVSLSVDYYTSRNAKKTYRAKSQILDPPVINTTAARFDHGANSIVTVELVNPNDPAVSKLQYRINRDEWRDYSGWISLSVENFNKGAKVRARTLPTAEYYLKSSTVETIIQRPPPSFSGSTYAFFSDPVGGPGMKTNLQPGDESDYFFWGTASHHAHPPSSLELANRAFSGVMPEERFMLATMEYFNGTIRSSTVASSVQLNVELSFDSGQQFDFEFTLNLINTPNSGVTPEEAADIVQLASLASSSTATIDGDEYYLVLEFGETSENGFSEVDEFRVLEDASATGNLYATLIPAGDLDEGDPYYFGDDIFLDDPPEEEYAPILLALDTSIFYPGLSSIDETATYHGLDADYLLNSDLVTNTGNPWLRWSEEHAGDEILLPGASLGPHGWFSLPDTTPWSAEDFALGDVPQSQLRRVNGVAPLTDTDFLQMVGRQVVGVVYEDDVRYNSRRGRADLRGNRRGRLAFTIVGLESTGGLAETANSGNLWDVRIRIDSPIETTIYDLDPWSPPTIIPPRPTGGAGGNGMETGTFISV